MIEKINKWLPIANLAVLVVIAVALVGGNQSARFGGITNYDALELSQGLLVSGSTTQVSTLLVTGSSVENGTSTQATTTTSRLWSGGNIASSTTASAGTVSCNDIAYSSSYFFTPVNGAVTLTLGASSTCPTWFLPNKGDVASWAFVNATGTAGTNGIITVAGNTGMNLMSASSTLKVLGGGKGSAWFNFIRATSTDIVVQIVTTSP